MSELKTSIVVDMTGNLARQAAKNQRALGKFSATSRRHMTLLRGSVATVGRGLDALGNRYTGLLTGVAAAASIKGVATFNQRMTRLGIQANISEKQVAGLKREIFDASQAPNIRVDPSEITAAIEAIVEKTGDLDFAREQIYAIGTAIQATGGSGAFMGQIAAEFQKMALRGKKVAEAIDILNVQGKMAAFTLADIARLGPRVITAYTATGRTGLAAVREMGTALQVISKGTGSAEQTATSFEALLRTLSDAKKIKLLQSGGIQVFDPEELKKGREILRPIHELMVDIVKATGGKKRLLSEVFDAEAIRAFNSLSSEFLRTGKINSVAEIYNVHADGSTTLRDASRAAQDFTVALTNLRTTWKRFADENLTGPIQGVADAINGLNPENQSRLISGLGTAAGVGVAAGAGYKYYKTGKAAAEAATEAATAAQGAPVRPGRPPVSNGDFDFNAAAKRRQRQRSSLFRAGRGLLKGGRIALRAGLIVATGAAITNPITLGAAALGGLAYGGYRYLKNQQNKAENSRALSALPSVSGAAQSIPVNGKIFVAVSVDGSTQNVQLTSTTPGIEFVVDSGLNMGTP